ncbi:YceI-like domain-containing protein [Tenacibaculum lutimaris]|uniref:YceI-like domain-containing protein n=1 Tax=Tenacibaculum lutimaris TaxID=285258 RepID=A0A420DZM4_9FLAO|nr:YceI family protein [Tenacibaculum lutimaris]RKF03301.1 YceI-like domain-containing protein [Tenacibaculum lutimaris]
MKKIVYSLVICFTIAQMISCKSEAKKETETTKEEVKAAKKAFVLQDATNTINWVAYKTTDKVPVKGQFQKVNITAGGEGNTAKEAINNAEFSIPVSSIFTQDSSRDFKIRKFFFGIMDKTELLSGKLVLENDSIGYADLTMNSTTKKLPFKYTLNGKEFSLNATMNISDWQAQNALDSLNTACKDLHKGADGVSKTWDDVALNITSVFK